MKISEHIENTIEHWREKWGEILGNFLGQVISSGSLKLMEALEKEGKPYAQDFVDRFPIPPEIKVELENFLAQKSPIHLAAIAPMAIGVILGSLIGTFMGWALPITKWTSYVGEKLIHSYRLDPSSIITAWRRDKAKYAGLFDDLSDQGWTEERIEALKFFTLYYPSPAELVHWTAREVFEADKIDKYGLMDDADKLRREDFYKAGMDDEQINNHWIAHWEHASWMQIVEMLHRGIITEQDVKDWFPLVEMAPYWAEHLIQAAYTWPTRVDVRRWWDMRTIDETELRRLYSGMGYRGVNLDNYVLWTKVYVAFPDLLARWTKGWISLDEVKSELTGLGMPADRVEEMIQTKVKPDQAERTATEKDITKTDIIKGVKKGVISRSEGVELLIDLGYDEDESAYILDINIPKDEEEPVVKSRELTKADILSGLKAAIITEPEALTKLEALRYTPDDARTILDIFKAAAEPPLEAWQREASKADIVAAVKKGLITSENAYLMLLDIGFSAEAANFILMVRAEVSPFSPINYGEFKELTQKYRVVVGKEGKPMSEELIAAGAEVVKLTKDVKALQDAINAEGRTLIAKEVLPEAATARRDELQVALHRAESALRAAQVNYDSLVAEWRHKP